MSNTGFGRAVIVVVVVVVVVVGVGVVVVVVVVVVDFPAGVVVGSGDAGVTFFSFHDGEPGFIANLSCVRM
jgi:hypothetical protein